MTWELKTLTLSLCLRPFQMYYLFTYEAEPKNIDNIWGGISLSVSTAILIYVVMGLT